MVVLLFAVLPLLSAAGCGKDEGKTDNPDLKVPEVAPQGSTMGKGDMSKKDKDKRK